MAGTLILEVIVMALTFPVVAKIGPGLSWFSGVYLGVVTLLLILAAGIQKRPRALDIDLGLQVPVILGGIFHWSIAVVGVIFLFVWIYIRYVRNDVARRMREGRLAGQEPIGNA
ncbi:MULTISPECIES: DUF4233 domain-containing protein [unclassified Gordonia (in: high G+C Gram-positive bacteria)]